MFTFYPKMFARSTFPRPKSPVPGLPAAVETAKCRDCDMLIFPVVWQNGDQYTSTQRGVATHFFYVSRRRLLAGRQNNYTLATTRPPAPSLTGNFGSPGQNFLSLWRDDKEFSNSGTAPSLSFEFLALRCSGDSGRDTTREQAGRHFHQRSSSFQLLISLSVPAYDRSSGGWFYFNTGHSIF